MKMIETAPAGAASVNKTDVLVANVGHGHEAYIPSAPMAELTAFVETETRQADYPRCAEVQGGIPIYDGESLGNLIRSEDHGEALAFELVRALAMGPGVVVVRGAWSDLSVVDRATAAFEQIIHDESISKDTVGDHFGKAGKNSRIWNALQKLCAQDPEGYVRYYANEILNFVATSWLGPGYRLTSQVNVVHPGGDSQTPHRDYHLGFMSGDRLARFPAHAHRMSPFLTLQAAVAHTDMPLASGPTLFLPYSQRHEAGYVTAQQPEFQAFFGRRHVQLPLQKGDVVFFNPAVMHAAGRNTTSDIHRMANLMLISSPMGVAMEGIDAQKICNTIYPELLRLLAGGELDPGTLDAVISVSADGYAFPTNLDLDPPVEGLSPATQQDFLRRAVTERWTVQELTQQLSALVERRRPC